MKMRTGFNVTALSLATCAGLAQAQSFSEGFEGGAVPANWVIHNQSSPIGTQTWGVRSDTVAGITPHAGTFYAWVNYSSGGGLATISNWFITPVSTAINNGDSFSFWTRTIDAPAFPDRLQARMSTAGTSVNTGSTATDVGDFTTLLLDINPTYTLAGYPTTYTQQNIVVSGLGAATPGRFALRYFVENGGPSGSNSDFIGVDDVAYTQAGTTGACCKPDGTCAESQTVAQCAALNGTLSAGVTCAAANCPQPGACCFPDGSCQFIFQGACTQANGGTWTQGSQCAAVTCPLPCAQISDFIPNGPVSGWTSTYGTLTTRPFRDGVADTCSASAMGGAPIAGSWAYARYDFQNTGATSACVKFTGTFISDLYPSAYVGGFNPADLTQFYGGSSGNSAGAGATLTFNFNVPAGANFSIIINEIAAGAGASGYNFQLSGGSLSCNNAAAQGACCKSDGTCTANQTVSQCAAQSGTWGGLNSLCTSCPPAGRCCKPDATCALITNAACNTAGGVWTAGGTCATACPTGACCKLDGSCAVVTPSNCASGVGIYNGDGSACAAANCPHVYTYGGAPVAIIDNQCTATNTYAELTVPDNFTITSADAAFFLPHTYQGDIKLTLTHVDTNTSVQIVNLPSGGLGNFSADNYGASAALPFRTRDGSASQYASPPVPAGGTANASGFWQPANPLSAFNGQSSAGTWRLMGQDCAGIDTGSIVMFKLSLQGPAGPAPCYANCDNSTASPVLNVADFTCFLTRYASGDPYANCDNSTAPPTLNVADFTCFLTKYAAGCP